MSNALEDLAKHLFGIYALIAIIAIAIIVGIIHYADTINNIWASIVAILVLISPLVMITALVSYKLFKVYSYKVHRSYIFYRDAYKRDQKEIKKLRAKLRFLESKI